MRKFTFKDVYDWKVIDVNGKEKFLTVVGKDGKPQNISRFDGYRSAFRAAQRLGGFAVRV
jgi:hypothetical protein